MLGIALPLILSTSSMTVMHFIDRMFLAWYSADSLAAVMPAGATSFIFVAFFMGTAGYASTFVSQYDGAGRPRRIGVAVWQAVYFALIGAVCMALLSTLAGPIFRLAGHAPAVQEQEIHYFRVVAAGGGGPVLNAALSSFFSGRGRTWTVMWVNFAGTALNLVLDYCWIFGKCGFPEWGIWGAAAATVVATWAEAGVYSVLILLPRHRAAYATGTGWRFDRELFGRLLWFGVPSGLQFMLDVFAFTVFVLLVGRIGTAELAANTVAFTVNSLVFLPMIGLSIATSVLVGRYLGANAPDLAARSTATSLRITLLYMGGFSIALVVWPDFFIGAFGARSETQDFEAIARIGRSLLYFVAGYSLVDGVNITYSAALKGAGDTRYVLYMLAVMAFVGLIVPVYVACVWLGAGIHTAWVFLTLYVFALASAYGWRYHAGYWRSMRVIEHAPAPAATFSEGPVVEA